MYLLGSEIMIRDWTLSAFCYNIGIGPLYFPEYHIFYCQIQPSKWNSNIAKKIIFHQIRGIKIWLNTIILWSTTLPPLFKECVLSCQQEAVRFNKKKFCRMPLCNSIFLPINVLVCNYSFWSVALLSVSNKQGLVEFAKKLHEFGYRLIASGGTANAIRNSNIPVR